MWKRSLIVTNPQRIITHLCTSRKRWGGFQPLLAQYFALMANLLCDSALNPFQQQAAISSKQGPMHPLYTTCLAPNGKQTKLVKKVERSAADMFLRC